MPTLLDTLNDRQRQAVTAALGPVLVLAGAGSGKTRVLAFRIAYLIAKKMFAPEQILALTFTNKAAREMKERISKLLPPTIGKMHPPLTMGTFHSVAVRILRSDIEQLANGYTRNFTIFDEDDSLRLLKQIVMELGLTDSFKPQVFRFYISSAKNKLIEPEDLPIDNGFLKDTISKVARLYQEAKREQNALDFDDLLVLTHELFVNVPSVLKKYQEKFQYVLVDEYQDTNAVQYAILDLLVKKHNNLFVVGDDAQSIYGFRGANMQNILDFKKDFPKAEVIMLEQNYRSTKPILDVANHVIGMNDRQFEKKLWTDNHKGAKVNLYEAQSEMDEARFVIERVAYRGQRIEQSKDLVYEPEPETSILDRYIKRDFIFKRLNPTPYPLPPDLNQNVILYRTHAQSRAFEEALLGGGIPYQIIGGIKFYERKEIKDVVAYLRLLVNSRDLVSLSRVINVPARGIGAANFRAVTEGLGKFEYDYGRLHLNLEQLELQARALGGARDFFDTMLRAKALPEEHTILDVMQLLLGRSGYKEMLLREGREGEARWENVEELFNVAAKFRKLPWEEGLEAFLEEVALMTDLDSAETDDNKLTLMTLHSAKGLEFDRVFFVGLEEGLLPHTRSMLSPQEIAEEIRLAYVGITRARRELFLSYARSRQVYGELKRSVPSRILKSIPENLINKLNES